VLLAFVFIATGTVLFYPRLPARIYALLTQKPERGRYPERSGGQWLLTSRIVGALLVLFGAYIGWTG
jgi:hypothetical protein